MVLKTIIQWHRYILASSCKRKSIGSPQSSNFWPHSCVISPPRGSNRTRTCRKLTPTSSLLHHMFFVDSSGLWLCTLTNGQVNVPCSRWWQCLENSGECQKSILTNSFATNRLHKAQSFMMESITTPKSNSSLSLLFLTFKTFDAQWGWAQHLSANIFSHSHVTNWFDQILIANHFVFVFQRGSCDCICWPALGTIPFSWNLCMCRIFPKRCTFAQCVFHSEFKQLVCGLIFPWSEDLGGTETHGTQTCGNVWKGLVSWKGMSHWMWRLRVSHPWCGRVCTPLAKNEDCCVWDWSNKMRIFGEVHISSVLQNLAELGHALKKWNWISCETQHKLCSLVQFNAISTCIVSVCIPQACALVACLLENQCGSTKLKNCQSSEKAHNSGFSQVCVVVICTKLANQLQILTQRSMCSGSTNSTRMQNHQAWEKAHNSGSFWVCMLFVCTKLVNQFQISDSEVCVQWKHKSVKIECQTPFWRHLLELLGKLHTFSHFVRKHQSIAFLTSSVFGWPHKQKSLCVVVSLPISNWNQLMQLSLKSAQTEIQVLAKHDEGGFSFWDLNWFWFCHMCEFSFMGVGCNCCVQNICIAENLENVKCLRAMVDNWFAWNQNVWDQPEICSQHSRSTVLNLEMRCSVWNCCSQADNTHMHPNCPSSISTHLLSMRLPLIQQWCPCWSLLWRVVWLNLTVCMTDNSKNHRRRELSTTQIHILLKKHWLWTVEVQSQVECVAAKYVRRRSTED